MADPTDADPTDETRDSDPVLAVLQRLGEGALVERGGFVVYANPVALRTLGYRSERELFFRPLEELVHPSERARLAGAGDEAPFELRLIRRTGEVVPIEARRLTVQLDGAPAVGLLIRDLSERRRLERQLQLADRMASVGTLASGVAHEVNTPLTYIAGNLEMMAELIADRDAAATPEALAELAELIEEAREGAARVHGIIRELRTFGRGPRETPATDIDLPAVIESVTRMAMIEIRKHARLEIELGETPQVHASPHQIHQILLNLLVNAAQSIERGDVDGNHIRVTTGVDASGQVLIEVADTGCGIEAGHLDRIFDPFFTTKDSGQGSGLGLWICHGLVGTLGGTIAVDSIVGRGTTFRVTLPPSR